MSDLETSAEIQTQLPGSTHAWRIFLIFLRLGLTSFGGPIAHLGYFHQEFVVKRKWVSELAYTDLVALCQFLPGPASSQVGISLGFLRGGGLGAICAWLGFTLPSATFMVLFGLQFYWIRHILGESWIHGLKIVAVAVVAQALWAMAKPSGSDRLRVTFIVLASIVVLRFPSAITQISVMIASGLLGWAFFRPRADLPLSVLPRVPGRITGFVLLFLFFLLLLGLPMLSKVYHHPILQLFNNYYRTGALVFGGGHVVLPLLQTQVVSSGWVSNDSFLAGYGFAQTLPGPLFSFAAYLGAISTQAPAGLLGAGAALIAIFLPSFFLVLGILPFWEKLRHIEAIKRSMLGLQAAVVGILLAAFYHPVWTSAIYSPTDFAFALVVFVALVFWKVPPWLVVILAGIFPSLVNTP